MKKGGFNMFKIINIGNQESAITVLTEIKENDYVPFDVRITNSHITNLNSVLGKKVFRKDALYVGSDTLWEIMQPTGSKGKHHHTHGLSPEEVFGALSTIKDSKDITISYDNRFVIVTLETISDGANIVVIVSPNCPLINNADANIIKIITIYPSKNKKWEPNGASAHTLDSLPLVLDQLVIED